EEYTRAMNAKRGDDSDIEDLSGRRAIEERIGMKAEELIEIIEGNVPKEVIDELWTRIKTVSDFSLNQSVRSGEMTQEKADHIRGMFEHYVPLRGHREQTAEEIWDYTGSRG